MNTTELENWRTEHANRKVRGHLKENGIHLIYSKWQIKNGVTFQLKNAFQQPNLHTLK